MSDKQREKLLFQYTDALEHGNIERLIQIIHMAEDDPVLDEMIADLDIALLEDSRTAPGINQNNHANSLEDNPMTLSIAPDAGILRQRPVTRTPLTLIAAILITTIIGGLLFLIANPPPVPSGDDGTPAIPQGVISPETEDLITRYITEVWSAGETDNLEAFVTEEHLLSAGDSLLIGQEALGGTITDLHDISLDINLSPGELELSAGGAIQVKVALTLSLESLDLSVDLPEELQRITFDVLFNLLLEDNLIAVTRIEIDEESLQSAIEEHPLLALLELDDLPVMQILTSGSTGIANPPEDDEGLNLPDFSECTGDFAPGLNTNTFTAPRDGAESATVYVYVPEGLLDLSEGAGNGNNIFEAEIDYTGDMTFEVSDMDGKLIRLFQNNRCDGYSIVGGDIGLSPGIALTTQFVVTSGILDADLQGLDVEAVQVLVQSGALNVDLSDTATPVQVDARVTSGSFDLTVPEGATVDSMSVSLLSGSVALIAESGVSFTADILVVAGSFDFEIAPETGLEIHTSGSAIPTIEMPSGMQEVETDVWQSDNFESSEAQVIIHLDFASGIVDIQH